MAAIWSTQRKYQIWLEIEAHAFDAMSEIGLIPAEQANALWNARNHAFDTGRMAKLEAITQHETAAFLAYLADLIGEEANRFVHFGMTSSDVLDTCFNLQLAQSSDLLLSGLENLANAFRVRAFEHKHVICVGRSHGVHGEPTTFGLKLAQAYAETCRNLDRLQRAKQEISTGQISGAMGTFANVDPSVEAHVCRELGLRPEQISTQVIPRDRHAAFFSTLSVVASSIERFAVEIRHLQRSEVLEVEERFHAGQIGSSAMPHKRNPILSENVTGLARLVRGLASPALENVALWHERDMSHSSVERVAAPQAVTILDFAIARLTGIVRNMIVRADNQKRNLEQFGGLVASEQVLLALVERGLPRFKAYEIVQRNAAKAWQTGEEFSELLAADSAVFDLINAQELTALLNPEQHLQHVDTIFERVFGDRPGPDVEG